MSPSATAERAAVDVVVTLGAVGWAVFWLNVVRLHLATDAFVDAAATVVLVIGPMLALLAWRLAGWVGAIDELAWGGDASGS